MYLQSGFAFVPVSKPHLENHVRQPVHEFSRAKNLFFGQGSGLWPEQLFEFLQWNHVADLPYSQAPFLKKKSVPLVFMKSFKVLKSPLPFLYGGFNNIPTQTV